MPVGESQFCAYNGLTMKNITTRLSSFRYPLLLAVAFVVVWTWWFDRAPATAQVVPTRIAVIDTERILLASNTGKAALAQLKKLQEAKEKQIAGMAQEIKDLQSKIESGQGPADGAAQVEAKSNALRRFQEDAKRELDKGRDKVLADIDARIMPLITGLGKELNYAFIFRKFESGLIYADESTDITNMVIARLDSPDK